MTYLINHLWQSTLFAGLAWLLTAAALHKNRPSVRYGVWMASSLKFLVPFAALAELGGRIGWIRPAGSVAPARLYTAMDQISRSVTSPASSPALAAANAARSSAWPSLLLSIWICGIVIVAINWFLKWRSVRAARNSAAALGTIEGVPVLASPILRDRGLEPGVFGLWHPVILTPEGLEDRLTPEQFEAILAHECCHAKRRDNLAAALHMAIEALFWFYPLVWWVGRKLMEERERACDEEVLRRSADPAIYAEAILNICKFYVESPLSCVPGVTGADLKRRISEIMNHRIAENLGAAKGTLLTAAAILTVTGPIVLGLVTAPTTRGQTQGSFSGIQTVANKKFDAATVKLNPSGSDGWRLGPPQHGGVEIDNLQLKKIIASSFRIQDSMVFGPAWLDSTRYDIVGKGPDASAPNTEVWEMMRSLLSDRFQMKYHIEDRPMSAYVLTVAKGGPKLKDPATGQCAEAIKAGKDCGDIRFLPFGVGINNMPIGALIGGLGRRLQDRPYQLEQRLPIVDKTGLTGKYDIDVTWWPYGMKAEDLDGIPKDQLPPDISLQQAMEQQAGLKLEAQKAPIPVVVVDQIEKPSEN